MKGNSRMLKGLAWRMSWLRLCSDTDKKGRMIITIQIKGKRKSNLRINKTITNKKAMATKSDDHMIIEIYVQIF